MNRFFLFVILFSVGCNSKVKNSESSVKLEDGCYISILQKDTAQLKIENNKGKVSGELSYNRFEKDDNKGVINGKIVDSLLIAYYTFKAEGTTSVRQVVFKIENNKLTEGFGPIIITKSGDTARFDNLSHIRFDANSTFLKTDCPE
jgi:hypothetical protein